MKINFLEYSECIYIKQVDEGMPVSFYWPHILENSIFVFVMSNMLLIVLMDICSVLHVGIRDELRTREHSLP